MNYSGIMQNQLDKIIKDYKFFWQYPVITEKTFHTQNSTNVGYFGFPWATVIDKKYNLNVVYKILKNVVNNVSKTYTCCQHILFRQLIPLWKALKITDVYIPHKIIGEDSISGINLHPCPLYAVNLEDPSRNAEFHEVKFAEKERKYLYSFVGAYNPQWYLTDIRKRIYEAKHPDNCIVKNTKMWHFEKMVYSKLQNVKGNINSGENESRSRSNYNKILLDSRYSLCPSGSGPNSIRFWESLGAGSIPILLADTLVLSEHSLWEESILRVKESDLDTIPHLLSKIDEEEEKRRRENCLAIYEYFRGNYTDKKTLFTSYLCDGTDELVQKILNSWKKLNPTFEVKYFSDKDVENFFKNTPYYDTYKLMKNGVAIADFFRICYINEKGGYWFDIDLEPTTITIPRQGNIHLFDAGFKNISYMVIGGKSKQKLFDKVIERVEKNIRKNAEHKTQHILDITGPRNIQNIICEQLEIKNKDGCLPSLEHGYQIYLKHTDYEFYYKRINFSTTKTNIYQLLQSKYKKKPYQCYNYI